MKGKNRSWERESPFSKNCIFREEEDEYGSASHPQYYYYPEKGRRMVTSCLCRSLSFCGEAKVLTGICLNSHVAPDFTYWKWHHLTSWKLKVSLKYHTSESIPFVSSSTSTPFYKLPPVIMSFIHYSKRNYEFILWERERNSCEAIWRFAIYQS